MDNNSFWSTTQGKATIKFAAWMVFIIVLIVVFAINGDNNPNENKNNNTNKEETLTFKNYEEMQNDLLNGCYSYNFRVVSEDNKIIYSGILSATGDIGYKENNEGISLYNTTISEYVKETENGIKLNTSTFVNSDKILDNLTITNIQLTYSSGVTSLTANVTNTSNNEIPITTITTILKDENKKEICKAKGVVKALGAGETGRINISMSGNFITAYDIEFSK